MGGGIQSSTVSEVSLCYCATGCGPWPVEAVPDRPPPRDGEDRMLLGELFTLNGLVTPDDVEAALEEQR